MLCAPGMTCFLRDAEILHLFKSIHPTTRFQTLLVHGQTSDKADAFLVFKAVDICAESLLLTIKFILSVSSRGITNGLLGFYSLLNPV